MAEGGLLKLKIPVLEEDEEEEKDLIFKFEAIGDPDEDVWPILSFDTSK